MVKRFAGINVRIAGKHNRKAGLSMATKVESCILDGVTECQEDCTKCILADLKSERMWLEQQKGGLNVQID